MGYPWTFINDGEYTVRFSMKLIGYFNDDVVLPGDSWETNVAYTGIGYGYEITVLGKDDEEIMSSSDSGHLHGPLARGGQHTVVKFSQMYAKDRALQDALRNYELRE